MLQMPTGRAERIVLARNEPWLRTASGHNRVKVIDDVSEEIPEIKPGAYTGLLTEIELLRLRDLILLTPAALILPNLVIAPPQVQRVFRDVPVEEELYRIKVTQEGKVLPGVMLSLAAVDICLQLLVDDHGELFFWGNPRKYSTEVWEHRQPYSLRISDATITIEQIVA
ncbi:MAG: hypothetical protein Kow001_02820 [Acidobacteriota bacterium]